MTNNLKNIRKYNKILLINSPALDLRLPWASWHQPVGLLKIGGWLRSTGRDVKFIDCLQVQSKNRLTKKKNRRITVENTQIDFWRIGLAPEKVIEKISAWKKNGWLPEAIFVSNGMAFWWEATSDLIQALKSKFDIQVYLGGAYPTYYYEHAYKHSFADFIIQGSISEATNIHSDLSLYESKPGFAAINIVNNNRKDLLAEIEEKFKFGIKTFALFDEYIGREHLELLEGNLAGISELALSGIRFIAPGNISPRVITKKVSKHLKQLNFKHIFFHDDVSHSLTHLEYLSTLKDYQRAMRFFQEAGFAHRTNELGAAVLIGLPHEKLPELTKRIVKLASVTGSIHLVPYQFTPGTVEGNQYETWLAQRDGNYDITNLNGRLFPLARLAGRSFDDYLELTRLVALLNSKFHSRTFDFLGDSLTANMVRKGLSERLWDPFKVKEEASESVYLDLVNNDN